MRRGIFIIYLIPFVLLIALLIGSFFEDEMIIPILLLQAIWAPFVIIHCIISFFIQGKFENPIPMHIKVINAVLLIYILFAVVGFEGLTRGLDGFSTIVCIVLQCNSVDNACLFYLHPVSNIEI